MALGLIAYALWSRYGRAWPLGPEEISEGYLT
jgi:hypothetical protein